MRSAGVTPRWTSPRLGPSELGLKGVTFPWRTIRGQECSGYWPAGTAAFHINADVADAVRRYIAATGDEDFEQGPGLELLVETARLWRSLGHHDAQGGFRIDRVTGPDEYTAIVDNNVFTNVMAARNMAVAADLAVRHPGRADSSGSTKRRSRAGATPPPRSSCRMTAMRNHPAVQRLHPPSQVGLRDTPPDQYPLLLHHHNYMLYSSQVIKQADLVFAIYLCGNRWTEDQKARDFAYYESVTVRDSSLSAPIQGVVAAEVGHLELALDYLAETAFIDLRDLAFNTRDGVHLASLSGVWHVIVAGFGGMRDCGDTMASRPGSRRGVPAELRPALPGAEDAGGRAARPGGLRTARRRPARADPPRRADHRHPDEPLTCPVPPVPKRRAPSAGRPPTGASRDQLGSWVVLALGLSGLGRGVRSGRPRSLVRV